MFALFAKIMVGRQLFEVNSRIAKLSRSISKNTREMGNIQTSLNSAKRAEINQIKMKYNAMGSTASIFAGISNDANSQYSQFINKDGSYNYDAMKEDQAGAQAFQTMVNEIKQNYAQYQAWELEQAEENYEAAVEMYLDPLKDLEQDLLAEKVTLEAERDSLKQEQEQLGQMAKENREMMFKG